MTFSSALFFQQLENTLSSNVEFYTLPGPTTVPVFTFANAGESESWGLELGLSGVYNDWLRWGTNYTYMFMDEESEDASGGVYYEDGQPEHQISIYGGFDHGQWEFDADLNYVSSYRHSVRGIDDVAMGDTFVSDKIEDYFVLNARAGYNIGENTNLAIEGYNLIDQHREWGGEEAITLKGATERPIGSSLGRSVLISLTHKF